MRRFWRRMVSVVLRLDDKVWGGSLALLLPAMVAIGWLLAIVVAILQAAGVHQAAIDPIVMLLSLPALLALGPPLWAAGAVFAERMWSTFFVYRLFGVQGKPIKSYWMQYAHAD